jgi:hypothetical protein
LIIIVGRFEDGERKLNGLEMGLEDRTPRASKAVKALILQTDNWVVEMVEERRDRYSDGI